MEAQSTNAVRAGRGRTLVVTWKNGAESPVDVSEHLGRFEVFRPLRDDTDAFRAATVGEWGWNAHWSDDMEISADTLWRLALEQGAAWLLSWRKSRTPKLSQAAAALGVSPRMWRYYEAGTHLLPKTVRLAALGLDREAEAA
ncbi:DUF2442 domain-containing protein [Methylobacterium sp. SyP6R]|uniref:DUF2442 domain-containing protein n=1 Tax=Methylobacterium sp. SyP6R TaxID=2718876 RepID=UPI001F3F0A9B|nr:DUF2442 domain-containing protein [Methylobacterium sp. SyP6R]MCF4130184.1 DUF2442 domain-containing protein [Methylobacterium sp. SyP6R]